MSKLYGGIEGGGTKFVCAVGSGPQDIRAEIRIPTTTPEETLGRAIAFFRGQEKLAALGVACFGPLDPNLASPAFGQILATPKAGWTGADVAGALRSALNLPVAFDTDVNGAALAEARWGAGQGCDPVLYLTVGTGIGGGALVNGKLLHGLLHPEMGHIPLPRDPARDPFPGICPFHEDCFEGLAAGPALERRWGQKAENLPPEHPAWKLEAEYIALALSSYILTLAPQKIILGGGVGSAPHLLPLVRRSVQGWLNGYVQSPLVTQSIENYIVLPALGSRAGVLGALALAAHR
ncbi:MAG: fructokinase [Anaerolineae bacterium CG_4_9_14_3_um_filter_57_17]|nr:ROK family protein [bacterium]NCT22217.1 ROK family protein [bacterium]OIO87228.1 MAG: fructokinase [Anaerolineae bacterium CG2_30_57_67]PJB64149.1 MAG: fructokinase [Anaerolineae bacterium CG_4_9_14_3_um_filter_57_17]